MGIAVNPQASMGVAVDPKNPVGVAVNLNNTVGIAVDAKNPMGVALDPKNPVLNHPGKPKWRKLCRKSDVSYSKSFTMVNNTICVVSLKFSLEIKF